MPKTFSPITESGPVSAPIGAKSTIVNTGTSLIAVLDSATADALQSLENSQRWAVLLALHSIEPGKSMRLTAGTYMIDLGAGFTGSAVLMAETSEPKNKPEPAQKVEPVAPVANVTPSRPHKIMLGMD